MNRYHYKFYCGPASRYAGAKIERTDYVANTEEEAKDWIIEKVRQAQTAPLNWPIRGYTFKRVRHYGPAETTMKPTTITRRELRKMADCRGYIRRDNEQEPCLRIYADGTIVRTDDNLMKTLTTKEAFTILNEEK